MAASPALLPILRRFQASAAALPKHARLRDAFVEAIESGDLAAGSRIAGERELSAALGLSLGTTQKGLNRLTDEGYLVRRQGHGTFVGSHRRPMTGTWHARFVAQAGGPELPVYSTIVERSRVDGDGPWAAALGPDPKGYVKLVRSLDVGGAFRCANQVYLAAGRFGRLLRMAERRLADVNLKLVLAEAFSAPTLHSDGLSRIALVQPPDARLMGVAAGSLAMEVCITAYSFGREPITFQRLLVPPTEHAMKLEFNPPPDGPTAPGL